MLSVEKAATPLTAVTVVVPASVPPAGFKPSATVTLPAKPGTRFPNASFALTCTAGLIAWPATALLGGAVNASWLAGPAVTVTVAVWVTATPAIDAVTVFTSATVELKLPVVTPLASVGAAGCVSAFTPPVADSTTVAPLTGLPLASRAVTVSVARLAPDDAGIEVGAAATVDCVADTAPAVMVKAALVPAVSPVAVAVSV